MLRVPVAQPGSDCSLVPFACHSEFIMISLCVYLKRRRSRWRRRGKATNINFSIVLASVEQRKKKVSTTTFLLIVSLSSLSLVLFCRTFFLSSLLHCCYSSSVPLALLSSLSTSNSFRLVVNRSSQRE